MRQYEIAKVAPSIKGSISNFPEIKAEDMKRFSNGAKQTVNKYLNTFYKDDDVDHAVFDGFYNALVQERSEL